MAFLSWNPSRESFEASAARANAPHGIEEAAKSAATPI
jgi:hypothetical protein